MTSLLGNFQSTSSVGFIFACIAAPVLVIAAFIYLYLKGFNSKNDEYRYGKVSTIPKIVLIWRTLALCFCIATISYEFAISNVWSLAYFTVWNWVLVCAYFVVGTAISFGIVFQHIDMSTKDRESIPKYLRFLQAVHQIFGEIEVPCSWLVTLVVWAYLAPSSSFSSFLTFTSVAQHIFNAVLMTIDFVVADYLVNPHHFPLALIWAGMYVIWHIIGNAAYGLMCYPFMKTDNPVFIAWFFGLALICVIFFFLAFALSCWKRRGWCKRSTPGVDDEKGTSHAEPDEDLMNSV